MVVCAFPGQTTVGAGVSQCRTRCVEYSDSLANGCFADYKSAIRQIANLRYARRVLDTPAELGPGLPSGGTRNAAFWGMAMLLVFWVLTSLVSCLAFLGLAARPVPRMDEPMASGTEAGPQRELGVLLQNPAAA